MVDNRDGYREMVEMDDLDRQIAKSQKAGGERTCLHGHLFAPAAGIQGPLIEDDLMVVTALVSVQSDGFWGKVMV